MARHLITFEKNQSGLAKQDLEDTVAEVLKLQLVELKQLNDIGNLQISGLRELLLGQIEHLSGQASDWVWSTNDLVELKGSKPIVQEEISLDTTMKEFNQMVSQQHTPTNEDILSYSESTINAVPTWSKILEPLVAVVVLCILYSAVTQIFV